MKNFISKAFISFVLFFPTMSTAAYADLTAIITPSRTTCAAPCGIHFEGTGSIDQEDKSIDSHGLHDNEIIDYTWDFGRGTEQDTSSGGRYFNGFNGAHVYEIPGTYAVSLIVTDIHGNVNTGMVTVEISSLTGNIFCFSNSTDFGGCPTGGAQITTDYWSGVDGNNNDILDYVAPGRQLYLKCGDTFTYENPTVMGEGPLLISAFGDGEKPQVQYTRTVDHSSEYSPIYRNGENVSITDITFGLRSSGNTVGARYGGFAQNVLLLRVDFDNVLGFNDLMFVVDSTLQNVDGNPSYSNAEKIAILNNDFGPSLSHGVYGECQHKGIFSGNYFHDVSNNGRTGIRIAANACTSENVIVTNNRFDSIPSYAVQMYVTTHVADRFLLNNILIKNNYFENCSGVAMSRDHGFSNITIQNNIFNLDTYGATAGTGIRASDQVSYTPEWARGVDSLWIFNNVFFNKADYHNVVIGQDDIQDFRFVNNIVYGTANLGWNRGVYVKYQDSLDELFFSNNLYYYPNKDENIFYVDESATAYNLSGWQSLGYGYDTNSFVADPLFAVTEPTTANHFRPQKLSVTKDAGETVPLNIDYDRKKRPQGEGYDIGPFEFSGNFYWPLFLFPKENDLENSR